MIKTTALFFLLSIGACNYKKEEVIPAKIIGIDTMISILSEFHLIEASVAVRLSEDKKINAARNQLKEKVYLKHKINKERFFESYKYYQERPILIDSIYTNIITEISKKQAQNFE